MFKENKKTNNLNVSDIMNNTYLDDLIKIDYGYKLLKSIRSSPPYWESRKNELCAMIRQLGKPTFFLTPTAGESQWPELLQCLMKFSEKDKTISLREAYELEYNEKSNLIRNDPVMCANYFNHKLDKFIKLLTEQNSLFYELTVEDYFIRIEFQLRGSPHAHILLWLNESMPAYENNNDNVKKEIINLIDRFITCEYNENDPYVNLQRHRHTHTCYKGKTKKCRFSIPYPVMKKTIILDPLDDQEKAPKSYESINKLMNPFYSKRTILQLYEEILNELEMTESEYLLAIRSTLSRPQVFLKRSSLEVGINAYNKDILHLWEANIDLQYILDEYSLMSYVTNYISKPFGGLAKILREAAEDCSNGFLNPREKLQKITNKFLNCNLMSAQEAAYHVLSLYLCKKSRKCIYLIQTLLMNELEC